MDKLLELRGKVLDMLDDILDAAEDNDTPIPGYVEENIEKVANYKKKGEYHFIFTDEDDKDLFGVEIEQDKITWYSAKQKKSKTR